MLFPLDKQTLVKFESEFLNVLLDQVSFKLWKVWQWYPCCEFWCWCRVFLNLFSYGPLWEASRHCKGVDTYPSPSKLLGWEHARTSQDGTLYIGTFKGREVELLYKINIYKSKHHHHHLINIQYCSETRSF